MAKLAVLEKIMALNSIYEQDVGPIYGYQNRTHYTMAVTPYSGQHA